MNASYRRDDAACAPAPEERLQCRHRGPLPAVPLDGLLRSVVLCTAATSAYEPLRRVRAVRRRLSRLQRANLVFFVTLERASLGFKRLEPKLASIYDPYFWFHERHWKLSDSPITSLFAGTPFRNMMMRAMGMKVGKMVFDCSQSITERTLTEVGDYANLNEGSVLQAHSLEEGVFKSDYIRVGNGCSIGPGAFVHYGVCMGDHVVLDADSFLMKGEVLAPHTGWRGNPARITRSYCSSAAAYAVTENAHRRPAM